MANRLSSLSPVPAFLAALAVGAALEVSGPVSAAPRPVQSAAAVEFEAASVKSASFESDGGVRIHVLAGGPGSRDPGLFRCINCTPWDLVMKAYNVERYQISGSDFLNRELMIDARVPKGATNEQFQTMLQNLLADRLKLTLHHQEKNLEGYALVVGKNGPKLKEPAEAAVLPSQTGDRPKVKLDENRFVVMTPGQPAKGMRTYRNGNLFSMGTGSASMEELAVELGRGLRQPVVEATGLKGKYEFILYWELETEPRPAAERGELSATGATRPTLSEALQKLGLRLEKKIVPCDVLVIDHIEKFPTAN